jgi:outer membrane protein TolC
MGNQRQGRLIIGIMGLFLLTYGGKVWGENGNIASSHWEVNSTLFPSSSFSSLLTPLKNRQLQLEKRAGEAKSKKDKWQWVAPVTLSYSYNRNSQFGVQKYRLFTIQINQPIFKSGAIYYSIKMGNLERRLNRLSVEKKRRELIKEAIGLAIDYKITQLQLRISQLNIENDKIDVTRKREQFLAGVSDSSFLNNAILKLNQEKLNFLQLKTQLTQLRENFQKISQLKIEKVPLPHFRLVSKASYLNRNLEYKVTALNSQVNYDLYRQQLGNSLFSINFTASWNWLHQTEPAPLKDTYTIVGIGISIPLSPSNYFGIEEQKLNYIKSRLEAIDKKRELEHQYNLLLGEYKNLQREVEIYKENEKVYRKLVATTRDSIRAGNATPSDLKTIENSLKISQLQQKIVYWKMQKLLLQMDYLLEK